MTAAPAYSRIERLLHRVALDRNVGGAALQKSLADIEARLTGMGQDDGAPPRPVFVTALPRAGTTLLLDLLSAVPEFATHTYRDMPFILAPLLWRRLSGRYRKRMAPRERAHGDGMSVDYDSPEAFEEVIWLAFWPGKYRPDAIARWRAGDRDAEFEAFFARHMRMLIAARTDEQGSSAPVRYLSKNNANVARLTLLPEIFPDCCVVAPLRDPMEQCRSLLRQHRRFLRLHAEQPFARRYMSWIGHFEFGADVRPIEFAGYSVGANDNDRDRLDYWLRYWIAAQRTFRATKANLVRFDYSALRTQPRRSLQALADALGVADATALTAQASRIRPRDRTTIHGDKVEPAEPALCREALALYAEARGSCVNYRAA